MCEAAFSKFKSNPIVTFFFESNRHIFFRIDSTHFFSNRHIFFRIELNTGASPFELNRINPKENFSRQNLYQKVHIDVAENYKKGKINENSCKQLVELVQNGHTKRNWRQLIQE